MEIDSYGVVTLGDHLLSLPGAAIWLSLIALGLWLVSRGVDHIPKPYRLFNYVIYGLCVVAVVTWLFVLTGLGFYVEA